jgi:hypothetical protein
MPTCFALGDVAESLGDIRYGAYELICRWH